MNGVGVWQLTASGDDAECSVIMVPEQLRLLRILSVDVDEPSVQAVQGACRPPETVWRLIRLTNRRDFVQPRDELGW